MKDSSRSKNEVMVVKFIPGNNDSWICTHPHTGGIIIAHQNWVEKGGQEISEESWHLATLDQRENGQGKVYHMAFPCLAPRLEQRAALLTTRAEDLRLREQMLEERETTMAERGRDLDRRDSGIAQRLSALQEERQKLEVWQKELAEANADIEQARSVFIDALHHIDTLNKLVLPDKRVVTKGLLDEFPTSIHVPPARRTTAAAA